MPMVSAGGVIVSIVSGREVAPHHQAPRVAGVLVVAVGERSTEGLHGAVELSRDVRAEGSAEGHVEPGELGPRRDGQDRLRERFAVRRRWLRHVTDEGDRHGPCDVEGDELRKEAGIRGHVHLEHAGVGARLAVELDACGGSVGREHQHGLRAVADRHRPVVARTVVTGVVRRRSRGRGREPRAVGAAACRSEEGQEGPRHDARARCRALKADTHA